MRKLELNRKTIIAILATIILLQSILYLIVASNKSYIHIDEGYSYGLINYDKVEITNNQDFYNMWHDKEYYTDYLTISSEESVDWTPVYEQQKNDVHPPFYYLLLRVANSFNLNNFSVWPGIILNIIIHIGITIFTYLISSKLLNNKLYGLVISLVGGLTVATLETILLTRMYALTALGILAITHLHMANLEKEKIDIKNLVAIGICAVLGSLTHYYYLVFLAVLYVIYLIRYIIRKQYKNAINYTITMVISAVVSLIIFPYSFVHMFMGYRGQGMLSNLTNVKMAWEGIGTYLGLTITNVYNGFLVIILITTIAILIYEYIRKKEISIKITNKYLAIIVLPTLIYFIIIAMGTPYKEIRYIMPIIPLLFIIGVYGFKTVLHKVYSERTINTIMLASIAVLLITPIILNWNITYLYPDMKEIVNELEEKHETPALYIFNQDCNRFMDDLYLFTKLDKSYIMDSKLANADEINRVLSSADMANGIILFINSNLQNDDYINIILNETKLEKCEYMKRLNACDMYYLY